MCNLNRGTYNKIICAHFIVSGLLWKGAVGMYFDCDLLCMVSYLGNFGGTMYLLKCYLMF
jgi:hypothetical protein